MKRIALYATVAILALSTLLLYVYNKPKRAVSGEAPAVSLTAPELFAQYTTDERSADSLYLNKRVQVRGQLREIVSGENGSTTWILRGADSFGVSCAMASNPKNLASIRIGDSVTVKGVCHGMLMDVVLAECTVVE